MNEYYPSKKVIFSVNKIRDYLLAPGRVHYREFADVGYKREDDRRLFNDIEEQFDLSKAIEDGIFPGGGIGYILPMTLGITKKKPFITIWSLEDTDPRPRFITAHRIKE